MSPSHRVTAHHPGRVKAVTLRIPAGISRGSANSTPHRRRTLAGNARSVASRSHDRFARSLESVALCHRPCRSSQLGLDPSTGDADFAGDFEQISAGPHEFIGELHRLELSGDLDRRPRCADRSVPRRKPVVESQWLERTTNPQRYVEACARPRAGIRCPAECISQPRECQRVFDQESASFACTAELAERSMWRWFQTIARSRSAR